MARIKKSLFDILKNGVSGSIFLDIFAGSGSVGMEALSRGARKVVFVDINPRCKSWIEANLAALAGKSPRQALPCQTAVHRADVLAGLGWLQEEFDIIFCGPPYKDEQKRPLYFVESLLKMIRRDGILCPSGWLIAQHHSKEKFEVPADWDFFRQEHYGDSVLSFFKHAGKN